ncbi:MAG: helix-turn-helix domain-containing protein [Microterricola sp.]
MIAAAEQLVAERGLGAVSMRMVGEAAGQRNHSAVQFHFGTWEGLLQSIAANRMGPINQERLAMLEQLDLEGRPADVRGLIEALIVPLSKWTIRRSGSFYARFLAVSYADPQWAEAVQRAAQGAAFKCWRDQLERALPQLPVPVRRVRIDHAVPMVIGALARWEGGLGRRGLSDGALTADLADTTVAFLTAPSSLAQATAVRPLAVES